MLPGGIGWRYLATVLLTVVLLVGCFGTAIGFVPAGGPDERAAGQPGDSTSETGVVHPALEDVEGEVTVVVRFPDLGTETARANSDRERGVRMRSHAADTQVAFEAFVDDHPSVRVDRSFWVANAKLVTVDTDAVDLGELAGVEGVREIHPNYRMESTSATAAASAAESPSRPEPTDHSYRTTPGLEQIRAPEVWDRFDTKGDGVSVAVLDTGVDRSHPDVDIEAENWAEFDDDGNRVDSSPYDSADHGTHTSGTVTGGNASGSYVGVAPEATLYHGKVLDEGSGSWAAATAGIEWAATEAGVDVISMSLSGDNNPSLIEPIQRANDLGVIVVASTGNDGVGTSGSPGDLYDTIAVGAVDRNGDVAGFSGGERVDAADDWPDDWPDEYVVPNVVAPGVGVRSSIPGDRWETMNGTSMAAPHVAGVVALIRAAGGDHLSQAEMRDLLERTASKPTGERGEMDTRYGAGVVDAYEATVHGTADSTVAGQVRDEAGNPLSGGRVDTEFDYGTEIDANGTFSLDVPPVPQELTVSAPGYEPESVAVSPGSGSLQRDVVLTNATFVSEAAIPPTRLDSGETVSYEFAVDDVKSVTVEAGGGTVIERGNAALRVAGEDVAFGEQLTFSEPRTAESLSVEVETTADTIGALELEPTFEGVSTAVTRTTPRTHVHPDPLAVPTDFDPDDLQSAVDVVAPNSTIAIDDSTSGPYALRVDGTAPEPSGLSIATPLALRAADGASPEFVVANHEAENASVGIDVSAPDADVTGIDLDAGGTNVGVRTEATATVTDTTVSNATVAFDLGGDTRGRNVSVDGGRLLDFDAANVTLAETDAPAGPPRRHEQLRSALAVESTGGASTANLSVSYAASDVTRLRNDTLGLWRYDESGKAWTPVDVSGVDGSTGSVTATLDSFGTVAPMGERLPAEFVLDSIEVQQDVDAGEALTVNATVANLGPSTDERAVELRVDGRSVADETVRLESGAEQTVGFSHAVDASGTVEIAVVSPDGAATRRIDIGAEESDDSDRGGSAGGGSAGGGDDGSGGDRSGGDRSGGSGGGGGDRSGGGGSGGGGVAPPPAAPPSPPADEDEPPAEETDDEANGTDATPDVVAETVAVVDSDPDRPGVSVQVGNTSISEITFRSEDAAGSLTVSEGVEDGPAAPPGTAVAQLEIEVPGGLSDRPATIRSIVDSADVGDDLTMYRHADGDWQPLETTVTTTDEGVLAEAETPGFSRFALVRNGSTSTPSEPRSAQVDTPTPGETATSSPTESPTAPGTGSPTEDDGAGFGAESALLALVVGLFVARRSNR